MVDDEGDYHYDLVCRADNCNDLEDVHETNDHHSQGYSHVKHLDEGLLLTAADLAGSR